MLHGSRGVASRLEARAVPTRRKRLRLQSLRRLWQLGLDLMTEAETADRVTPIRRARQFRDGLIIALLAARPMRRATLLSMQFDRHLILSDATACVCFDADEVKERRAYERELPSELVAPLHRYRSQWRPILLAGASTPDVWVTRGGRRLSADQLYTMVTGVTRVAFGVSMSPHLFRDAAATAIAVEAPADIGIVMPVLGHASSGTIERHYNQAGAIEAMRAHAGTMTALRRQLRGRCSRVTRSIEP
jgi:integrase